MATTALNAAGGSKRRRGYIAIALISGLIGFVLGNAFWYLASPLWIDVIVDEQLSGAATSTELVTGTFADADSRHQGSGNAVIVEQATGERIVRFTEFAVTNGPDLEVWLVAHPDPKSKSDVLDAEWLSLGQLKGNIGDQNYPIPADAEIAKYQSVVIWCEQFGVLFSAAPLR
ncbi:MAG: DM13 domain-containing protein [Alphaproteobacteria bacterium]|nr:DM13 domain-containing protein [Alphaproteobacteria bacterium]